MTSKNVSKSLETAVEYEKYVTVSYAFKYFPIAVARAKGARIWDKDGNEYIDFLSSAATYNIGHTNDVVIEAVRKQLEKFIHYCLYLYHDPAVELAKLLVEITPGGFTKKVSFGLSGGDACDTALKASLLYTKRKYIGSYTYSYHGTTYLALSVSASFSPELRMKLNAYPYVYFFEYPDTYRCPLRDASPEECGEYYLSEIDDVFRKKINGESFAALMFEPVQGDGGVLVPPKNYVEGIRKITREYGIVFIDDEIQTGMGRTGKLFAIEHFGVEPDLIVLGKALGGGMPVSAVVGKAEILDSGTPQSFFATSGAHAVSVAAAIATIKYVQENNLAKRAMELGDYAMKRLNELKEKYEVIGDVRGLGLMLGVDIVKNKDTKEPDRKTAIKIIWRAWEKGLLMMTYGKYGNVLRIAPPLVITREELDKAIDIIDESIRDVLAGKVGDEVLNVLRAWE
ncbi:aspartate aminotransferase family protein [Desulfurococcaceae archaeon MEX13E-LK6-19]|nr:aspartate aminotransferase family protein [Desulfurococcaceae archaeon MEX13E-LK6-19]